MENRRDSFEGDYTDGYQWVLGSDLTETDPVLNELEALFANFKTELKSSSSAPSSGDQENNRGVGSSRVRRSRKQQGRGLPLSREIQGNDSMQWELNPQTPVEAKMKDAERDTMTKVPSVEAAATAGVQERNMNLTNPDDEDPEEEWDVYDAEMEKRMKFRRTK